MATKLQRQLAVIAASSAHELDLRAQKSAHSKSLIFEPKIAASQPLEVVYQICIEGFEELCELDSRFAQFRRSLFSAQSVAEDRSHMTESENNAISNIIHHFLWLVNARLLLQPAVKAVEWLVRRFRVHEYDVETLILTFLPYHETPVFKTMLSLLPKELPLAFRFLHPYINSLSNPPRSVIIHTSINNQEFFTKLNQYILNSSKAGYSGHVLLSFWSVVSTQTVHGLLTSTKVGRKSIQSQSHEDISVRILSFLDQALKIRKVPELTIGCYMMIVVLVMDTRLRQKTLDALLKATSQTWTVDTFECGIKCAAVIWEQGRTTSVPRPVAKAFLESENFTDYLKTLNLQNPGRKFVLGITDLISHEQTHGLTSNEATFINFVLKSKLISTEDAASFVETMISKCEHDMLDEELDVSTKSRIYSLLSLLRQTENQFMSSTSDADDGSEEILNDQIGPGSGPIFEKSNENSNHSYSIEDRTIDLGPSQDDLDENNQSFLRMRQSRTYFQLLLAYEKAVQTGAEDEFFEQSLFEEDSVSVKLLSMTFLARVWCTHRQSNVRANALDNFSKSLDAAKSAPLDLQILIPYLLVALKDVSREGRKAAVNTFVTLQRIFRNFGWNKSSCDAEEAWGIEKIYGVSNIDSHWLPPKTIFKFIDLCLLPNMEESINDKNALDNTLKISLDSKSSSSTSPLRTPSKSRDETNRIKSAMRTEVFRFLCEQISLSPMITARLRLLQIVNGIDKVAGSSRTSYLMPCLEQWCSKTQDETEEACKNQHIILQELDMQYATIVQTRDQKGLQFLTSFIKREIGHDRTTFSKACSARLRALWPNLKSSSQKGIVDDLLSSFKTDEFGSTSERGRKEIVEFLKNVHIHPNILANCINETLADIDTTAASRSSKKRRISTSKSGDTVHASSRPNLPLMKLSLMLELVDGQSVEADMELSQALFKILQLLYDYKTYSSHDLAYLVTLVLENLHSLILKLGSRDFAESSSLEIRVDLLVNCARTVKNAEARNSAILILAEIGRRSPNVVIKSIIPIFTLMSNTVMTNSDEFSAHVVDQTVQIVIPLIAQSLREHSTSLISATSEILLSFAAAFEHIPPHRRLRLFGLLATSMGPEDCLFAILITLVDRFPENESVVRFAANLLGEYYSSEIVVTIHLYLVFIQDCFKTQKSLYEALIKTESSQDQKIEVTLNLLSSLSKILNDRSLQTRLYHNLELTDETTSSLQEMFSKCLEAILGLFELSKSSGWTTQYQNTCIKVFKKLLNLSPPDALSLSVQHLLDNADPKICQIALQSLIRQIDTNTSMDEYSKRVVLGLMPRLTKLLEDSKHAGLKQSSILSLDKLCEKFGKLDTSLTHKVAETLIRKDFIQTNDFVLRSLTMHALASTVKVLGKEFIPHLQSAWTSSCTSLEDSTNPASLNLPLHNAVFSFLIAVVETIPFMVSRTAFGRVLSLAYRSNLGNLDNESKEMCEDFLRVSATRLGFSTVIEAVSTEWPSAIMANTTATQIHLRVLRISIEQNTKKIISRNLQGLFDVIMAIMDLRRQVSKGQSSGVAAKEISHLEQDGIDTFMALVMKINDVKFRPFFLTLIEWATDSLPTGNNLEKTLRLTTLFRFLKTFSDSLKSLATTYFGHVVSVSRDILTGKFDENDTDRTLKSCTLQALTSSFTYDQDDFWQAPSHFDMIAIPLVSGLASQSLNQVNSEVIPAITELAAVSSSSDHYKTLNSEIMKLCRSESATIRLSAVKCGRSLTKRLGDDWLANLPEMLPFISELQEDDDEKVELETSHWIKEIENILGENLRSMLQ